MRMRASKSSDQNSKLFDLKIKSIVQCKASKISYNIKINIMLTLLLIFDFDSFDLADWSVSFCCWSDPELFKALSFLILLFLSMTSIYHVLYGYLKQTKSFFVTLFCLKNSREKPIVINSIVYNNNTSHVRRYNIKLC